jgi:hypothetical protein
MRILEIEEILHPADQGRTTPFLCRAEDGLLYYVKGKNAGSRSQCAEWTVAHLALEFGLQIPEFAIVNVHPDLLAESSANFKSLGSGLAFASLYQRNVQWFEPSFVDLVPADTQRDVLVFDWWIQNLDRLSDNTNLLWNVSTKSLVVIDHDVAFEEFWPTVFLSQHIFKDQWEKVTSDLCMRSEYESRMMNAMKIFESAYASAPVGWKTANSAGISFDYSSAKQILDRCSSEALWKSN